MAVEFPVRFSIEGFRRATQQMGNFGERAQRSMRTAERATTGLNRQMGILSRVVDGVRNNIGSLAAGLGVFTLKQVFNDIQALNDAARSASLPVETFQSFAGALRLIGEDTKGARDAIVEFSLRLGEARNGEGQLLEALEKYPVALQNVDGSLRDNRDIMFDYLDTIAAVTDETEQLRLADLAFGEDGSKFIDVFRRGSEVFKENEERLRSFNALLSTESAAAAAEANTNFGSIIGIFQGQFRFATAELTPIMESLNDALLAVARVSGKVLAPAARFVAQNFETIASVGATVIGVKLAPYLLGVTKAFTLLGGAVRFAMGPFGLATIAVQGAIAVWNRFPDQVYNALGAISNGLTSAAETITGYANTVIGALGSVVDFLRRIPGVNFVIEQTTSAVTGAVNLLSGAYDSLAGEAEDAGKKAGETGKEIEEALDPKDKKIGALKARIIDLQNRLKNAGKEAAKTGVAIKELSAQDVNRFLAGIDPSVALQNGFDELEKFAQRAAELGNPFSDEQLTGGLQRVIEQFKGAGGDIEQIAGSFGIFGDAGETALQRVREGAVETAETVKTLNDQIDEVASGFGDSLAGNISDALFKGESLLDGFKNTFRNVFGDIANRILKQTFTDPLSDGIAAAVKGVLGTAGGQSGASGEAGPLGPVIQNITAQTDGLLGGARDFFSRFGASLSSNFSGVFQGISSSLGGILQSLASGAGSLFSSLTSSLGSLFSGGGGAGLFSGIGSFLGGLFHEGGIVGKGGLPIIAPASIFEGARRYHTGGLISRDGLASDEVPAILQTNERVLSRTQNVAFESMIGAMSRLVGSMPRFHTGGVVHSRGVIPKFHDGGVVGPFNSGGQQTVMQMPPIEISVNIDARGRDDEVVEQIDSRIAQAMPGYVQVAVSQTLSAMERRALRSPRFASLIGA